MADKSISAGSAVADPINPAGQLPFYDPNAPSTDYSPQARQVAATVSPVVVTLSSRGITSDATNGIQYSATSPAGSTGQEAAINAILAAVSANGTLPSTIIWDVAVALGAPIYIWPFQEIIAPSKACGIIMRAASNCPMVRIKGCAADMTIAANTQATFGKFDSGAPGGSHNYRVFDSAFVNAQRVSIRGGTWNGNEPAQTQQSNVTYGWISGFQMWGVDELRMFDMDICRTPGYGIHVINVRDFDYGGLSIDNNSGTYSFGEDCIHFNGPVLSVRGGHVRTHCNDDDISICPDDIANSGNLTAGINYGCGGDITDVRIEGPDVWSGTSNTTPIGCVRVLSNYHRADEIYITGARGVTSTWGVQLYPWGTPLCAGSGNYGHIVFEDHTHDLSGATLPYAPFYIDGVHDFLEIRNRYRYNAQATPDINIVSTAVIARMNVEWDGYEPTSAGSPAQPAVLCAGNVGLFTGRFRRTLNTSVGVQAAPFLKTATGCLLGVVDLDCDGDWITNLVDHQAGTIETLVLRGVHRHAAGGLPLNVAAGATVTNYIPGNGAYPLATVATTPWWGGAGTVTNAVNTYGGP